MTMWAEIVLVVLSSGFIKARDQIMAVNDCTCQGYNVTYECTVFGSGATIWKGTAFDCPLTNNELTVFHSINFTSERPKTCNNGAIAGHAIGVENGSYTSQITVQISDELSGTTLVCAHDNGTDTIEVGSAVLSITTVPFPPPTDIQLVEANHTQLSFTWSPVSSHCLSLQYHIVASNCGKCPVTTATNKVTCTGNYLQLTTDNPCSFAVRTTVCNGIFGDISTTVTVAMIEAGLGPVDNKTSSDNDAALQSSIIVIAHGAVVGAMFIVIVFITILFATIVATLLKSKRALHVELDLLRNKMKEQPVIYEEITQLQDSVKSSSPAIDVGENTAYVSVTSCRNACTRIST